MDNKIIFGTDGWRGLLDEEVNEYSVKEVAQAFSLYLFNKYPHKNNISVAVGYDGRKYSEEFAHFFASVLSGNHITVFLSDTIIPTPLLSFFVKNNKLEAGVMITASHNPAIYNGIKFKAAYGGPFLTEETIEVEKLIGHKIPVVNEKLINVTDFINPYSKHIEMLIDFPSIKKSGITLLIDSMSGAGQKIIETLLDKFEIKSDTIYETAEHNFSERNAEPIEQNLIPLKKILLEYNKYSMGLATDGDADRLGVTDEKGDWVTAQETIFLLTDYIKNKKMLPGNIVKTSSVTDLIRTHFENDVCKVIDVQVGFKYITEEMLKGNVAFGCEESGGYGYGNHIPERDGILSGLLFAEMLAKSGFNKLSDYLNDKRKIYGNIFYRRIDFHYHNNDRVNKLPIISENLPSNIAGIKVESSQCFFSSRNIVNGLKFYLNGNTRWLLLRSSETEPMFRIYAEGQSGEEVTSFLEEGKKLISFK